MLGEFIKKAIDVYGIISSAPEPLKAQLDVLKQLLEKAKFTAFGKKFGFSEMLSAGDTVAAFQEQVPVFDYDRMYDEWWHYLLEGHQNVSWPGGQSYFALSSGTTSHSTPPAASRASALES